jgi:hypothetical protein
MAGFSIDVELRKITVEEAYAFKAEALTVTR